MKYILTIGLLLNMASCVSYIPINPSNGGNGWIVKKSLFTDSLMYCQAPASRSEKPLCVDAIEPQSFVPSDGLDTFINPKKSK